MTMMKLALITLVMSLLLDNDIIKSLFRTTILIEHLMSNLRIQNIKSTIIPIINLVIKKK
jgi:hypothetical protein